MTCQSYRIWNKNYYTIKTCCTLSHSKITWDVFPNAIYLIFNCHFLNDYICIFVFWIWYMFINIFDIPSATQGRLRTNTFFPSHLRLYGMNLCTFFLGFQRSYLIIWNVISVSIYKDEFLSPTTNSEQTW